MTFAVSLTGCGLASRPEIPKGLLSCAPSPQVPGPKAKSREVSTYVVDLYDAHKDCEGNLAAVRKIVTNE